MCNYRAGRCRRAYSGRIERSARANLVGTRGPLAAAVDPLQPADHLRDRHPFDQRGDAAGVSLTPSVEEYAANGVTLQFDLDGTRTGARGGIEQFVHKK